MSLPRVLLISVCLWLLLCDGLYATADESLLANSLLQEDIRTLAGIIIDSHPDPYAASGGMIAFHRRLTEMMDSLGTDGMNQEQFYRHLLPFVAAIGDSHTALMLEREHGEKDGPGLPLGFKIIEESLVVDRGYDSRDLVGGRLQAVAGVPFAELLERQSRLRGIENISGLMALLSRSLGSRIGLARLLPAWRGQSLEVELLTAEGKRVRRIFQLDAPLGPEYTPESRIEMPSTDQSDMAVRFLDESKTTALLVVANMMRFREGSESWFADGMQGAKEYTQQAFQHYYKKAPPEDQQQLLAALPSATEVFLDLRRQLVQAKTKTLIIDLRKNTGGNGCMIEILIYALYGDRAMRSLDNGYSIQRYSKLFFEAYQSISLEQLNQERSRNLVVGDYDFTEERSHAAGAGSDPATLEKMLVKMPTFWRVYRTGEFHKVEHTPQIIVLCSPWTYSSGFNMLTALLSLGAKSVGTSPAQPPNNFGDVLPFTLPHSKIKGYVSYKRIITYPNASGQSNLLKPHLELDYKKFAEYKFDPQSELLLALENRRQ